MSTATKPFRPAEPALRQAAFSVEQLTADAAEPPDRGAVTPQGITRALRSLGMLRLRPGAVERRRAEAHLIERIKHLRRLVDGARASTVVYLEETEYALEPRLRAAAIEVDFYFGNRDGHVSPDDLRSARRHYCQVRGPEGWNRLLQTDELERRLFPERTLCPLNGIRLRTTDWLRGPHDPVPCLDRAARTLDDRALARTYADAAAHLAVLSSFKLDDRALARSYADAAARLAMRSSFERPVGPSMRAPPPRLHAAATDVFERALRVLGAEIRRRDSVRPTISDIARIGREDPNVKAVLRNPIEMSRRLCPVTLLDPYLDPDLAPRI